MRALVQRVSKSSVTGLCNIFNLKYYNYYYNIYKYHINLNIVLQFSL